MAIPQIFNSVVKTTSGLSEGVSTLRKLHQLVSKSAELFSDESVSNTSLAISSPPSQICPLLRDPEPSGFQMFVDFLKAHPLFYPIQTFGYCLQKSDLLLSGYRWVKHEGTLGQFSKILIDNLLTDVGFILANRDWSEGYRLPLQGLSCLLLVGSLTGQIFNREPSPSLQMMKNRVAYPLLDSIKNIIPPFTHGLRA